LLDCFRVFAFFSEVCYNIDPYATLIQETREAETKVVRKGSAGTWPYVKAGEPRPGP